jgi:single-strand DNA-binding protein
MSDGLNMVTLLGNLGADPELKLGPKGPVLKMRLATEYTWKNKEKNERDSRTEWHTLTMFGPRAEALSKHLHKGDRVMIKGHLQTHDFEKDGQKHYRTEVIVEDFYFAGSARANGAFIAPPREAAIASSEVPF